MNYQKAGAWFIVILMTFSIFGYVGSSYFSEDTSKKEYNGHLLIKINNQWLLKKESKDYYFLYHPEELSNLTIPASFNLYNPKIYLAFQPNETLSVGESINVVGSILYQNNIQVQQACLTEPDCPDIPIMNCEKNIGYVFQSGSSNSYSEDKKCLIITAVDNENLQRLTERLIYQLLGVMS